MNTNCVSGTKLSSLNSCSHLLFTTAQWCKNYYNSYFYYYYYYLLHFRFWGTCAEHARQLHRYTCGSMFSCLPPLHPHLAFLPMLSLPSSPPRCPSPIPLNRPQCVVLPTLCPCVLIVHQSPVRPKFLFQSIPIPFTQPGKLTIPEGCLTLLGNY